MGWRARSVKRCEEYFLFPQKKRKKEWISGALTSLVLRVRMRSRSSTSCLKVGLWDEMACQQSFIIMYLVDRESHCVYFKKKRHMA